MGESALGARLSCRCRSCLTWRRIGEEIHLGHEVSEFTGQAADLLAVTFNSLLDLREQHRLDIWRPVAAGAPGDSGEAQPPPTERKRRRDKSPSGSPKVKIEKPKRRAKERSPGHRERRVKPKSEDSPSEDRHQKARRSRTPRPSKKKVAVKEEPSEIERNRLPTQALKGEASPGSPKRRSGGEERRERPSGVGSSGANSCSLRSRPKPEDRGGEIESDLPPGTWTLRERPAEPNRSPGASRPPEPPGPPPGWVPRRSKGIARRERNEDIFNYGPSSERKQLRLDRRL